MQKIKNFSVCIKNMEPVSKKTVLLALWLVLLTYAAGIAVLCLSRAFADLSTALYWAEQLGLMGRELLGATIVPVLIFEILWYGRGMK